MGTSPGSAGYSGASSRGAPTTTRSPTRILIVEDEGLVAFDLKESLEELGHVVVGIAASSNDAVAKAIEHQPELLLMDIRIQGDADD